MYRLDHPPDLDAMRLTGSSLLTRIAWLISWSGSFGTGIVGTPFRLGALSPDPPRLLCWALSLSGSLPR